ncbi:MAG: M20/M25/M40 family metallo-hydrolase [Gemmatimonadales bacterium]
MPAFPRTGRCDIVRQRIDRRYALALALALGAAPLAAQTSSAVERGAASITAGDVAHRIGVVADDSMLGRDTPSRGLELTARYVADQFRKFGLKPAGDRGGWLQRYPISRRQFDTKRSRVSLSVGGVRAIARFDGSAHFLQGQVANGPVTGPAVLVGGRVDAKAVKGMMLKDRVVLYAADVAGPTAARTTQVTRALRLAGAKAILLLVSLPPADFAARVPRVPAPRVTVDLRLTSPPIVELGEATVAPVLRAARVNPAAIRADTTPVLRRLPMLRAIVELRDSVLEQVSAPNTVGILEGRDPALRDQYLIFSAHMDHIGISPGQPDSINNGADDDGSGTAGVMALAEAFSRPGARPKRSIIFLTVSGEEKGLWGSRYFSEHPPVPIDHIVADLNMDMIGRNWRDTIVAIGREHSDLGATLARVNEAHPELDMTAIDDRWPEERFYFRSDHYNFARKGIPILFFFNGVHPDYHRVTDSPDKIDSEKESRILRLVYYLGQAVGNAAERPKWNPDSYREIVDDPGG